jgi:hypothetical protein
VVVLVVVVVVVVVICTINSTRGMPATLYTLEMWFILGI